MQTKNRRMDSPAIGLLQVQNGLQVGGQLDENTRIVALLSPSAATTVDFAADASRGVDSETLSIGDGRRLEEGRRDDGDEDGSDPS